MNHLDVGYNGIDPTIGFIPNVLNRYFTVYFPRAISLGMFFHVCQLILMDMGYIAQQLVKRNGSEQFIYTTHPWLVSYYLDCPSGMSVQCPSAADVQSFKDAVNKGWITWHRGRKWNEIEFIRRFDSDFVF